MRHAVPTDGDPFRHASSLLLAQPTAELCVVTVHVFVCGCVYADQ